MPHQTFHFIAGLPRSGSTLLSAILRQNPEIHAEMTSPVGTLFDALLAQLSAGSEFGPVVGREKRKAFLKGLFTSYYPPQETRPLIFDTYRGWCSRLPALFSIFPDAKIICCVRNVAWIMDSMERQFRKNPFEYTRLFNNPAERNTVYSRVDTLAQRDRLVGFAWCALKEAVYGPHAKSLLLVDYDLLTRSPAQVMTLIYQFIDQPFFRHDFDNLVYDAPDFDRSLGVEGLHRVRPKVAPEEQSTLLPPDLFQTYSDMSFWQDLSGTAANVIAPDRTGVKPVDKNS